MKINFVKAICITSALSLGLVSCDRFLDITPTGKVIPQTTEDFRAMLTRAYHLYPQHIALTNLKTDEVKAGNASESLKAIFTWGEANAITGSTEMPYGQMYQAIFYTNYIIQNATKYATSSSELNQVLGEAYAFRAYTYFQLVNLYAPAYNGSNGAEKAVPIITKVQLEGDFPRATIDQVYSLIQSDITEAEKFINQSSFEEGYNYRFTTTALTAFKARVFQYRLEWENALREADKVLEAKSDLEDFNQFSVLPSSYKSKESIMNLDFAVNATSDRFSRVSNEHLGLYDQDNDLRFVKYFRKDGSNYRTTKYSTNNEFKVSFRIGEIYLVKAEAEARLNRFSESKNTLLKLAKTRYNATGYTNFETKINGMSNTAYITELLNERARELSFEGLRWFDLRRTTQPEIIHIFDGDTYTLSAGDARYTIPFPREARLKNPVL